MMTKCRVGYHFYKLNSWTHLFLRVFTGSTIGHCEISVQTDNGISYYDCSWPRVSGWYTGKRPLTPFDSLYENTELDLSILNLLLPQGEKYVPWKVATHWYTGYPKSPSSCISSIHRIRFLIGKKTKGRSPGGLYRYLKHQIRKELRNTT